MIGIPMNPNSVYIPMVQIGCCKAEFDTTYPVHLNGIIGQGEFVESIEKINRSIFAGAGRRALSIFYICFVFISMLLFIFGGISAGNSRYYGFPPLIAAGMGVCFVGTFIFIILLVFIQIRQATRLRQAVAEESMKYTGRSTPCSWRLEVTRYYAGYGNNRQLAHHIIVDIGRQIGNESSYQTGQNNQYAPPSYSDSSKTSCTKCGAAQPDLSARFCPSCGQAFSKY